MTGEEPASPSLLRNLLVFTEKEQNPTTVGTDANATSHYMGDLRCKPLRRGSAGVFCKCRPEFL